MGCGNSTGSAKTAPQAADGTPVPSRTSSGTSRTSNLKNRANVAPVDLSQGNSIPQDLRTGERTNSRNSGRDSGIDSAKTSDGRRGQANGALDRGDTATGSDAQVFNLPRPVAFEVAVTEENGDSIIRKHPPRRLQRLENAPQPKLTSEMLEEKLRLTEERRLKALSSKGDQFKRSSKRRKDLMAAMQFSQQTDQQVTSKKLDDKIDSAARNREKVKAARIAKQRQRELRARQAKVKRLQNSFDEETFDVEKDETFNADDDVDSWLDGENNNKDTGYHGSASTTTSERIYDGRSSPLKRLHPGGDTSSLKDPLYEHSDNDDMEAEGQWVSNADSKKQPITDDFFDT